MRSRLEGLIALALTGLVGFSLAAVPLAMLAWFRPLPVFSLSILLWILLWLVWRRGVRPEPQEFRGRSRPFVVLALVVVLVTGMNVRFSAQHVLTERDPGVYNTTAKWLADRGSLLIDPESEPYRGITNEHRVHYRAAGYYEGHRVDGKIYPQFAHLLPTVLAAGSWIGGSRGMMKVNALLSGLALLVVFAFALRLMKVWAAVGVAAALGFNLVQAHFGRDAYTEILTQILLFGGLWALWSARSNLDAGRATVAGLLLGSTCMTRIDAFVFLVPLAAYLVYELWTGPRGWPRRRHRTFLVFLCLGVAIPVVLGWLDLRYFSPPYLSALWGEMRMVWLALALVGIGGAVGLMMRARLGPVRSWVLARRHLVGGGIVVLVAAGAAYAYFVRPHVDVGFRPNPSTLVEYLQQREGLPIDGRRTYTELGLRWLGLYLGWPALAIGLAGLSLVLRQVITGKLREAVPFVLFLSSMTALYVWKPNITPDHLWAMRRYLTITFPGLIICIFWLIAVLYDRARSARRPDVARGAVLGAAAITVLFAVWTLAPVVTERTHLGALRATEALCRRLPQRSAVLVAQTALLDLNFTQTVRSFCGVPAATAPMDQPLDWYREIARRWAVRGRTLYVISPQPRFGTYWPDESIQVASIVYRNLERTVSGRPDDYETFPLALYVTEVSP